MADRVSRLHDADTLDTEFTRGLGLYDATMVVVGSMIGSGIFIVSADMARLVGSPGWLLLAWVVTGVLTITAALSYGELAAMMPRAGDGQQSGQHPRREQPPRAPDVPRHVGRDDEDARPDHRPDHHHRRVVEAQAALELGVERGQRHVIGGGRRRRARGSRHAGRGSARVGAVCGASAAKYIMLRR